jgi:hypothetical protein
MCGHHLFSDTGSEGHSDQDGDNNADRTERPPSYPTSTSTNLHPAQTARRPTPTGQTSLVCCGGPPRHLASLSESGSQHPSSRATSPTWCPSLPYARGPRRCWQLQAVPRAPRTRHMKKTEVARSSGSRTSGVLPDRASSPWPGWMRPCSGSQAIPSSQ